MIVLSYLKFPPSHVHLFIYKSLVSICCNDIQKKNFQIKIMSKVGSSKKVYASDFENCWDITYYE